MAYIMLSQPTEEYQRRFRWFEKKRPDELEAVVLDARDYLSILKQVAKPMQMPFGFIHAEPMGVYGIDQRRPGQKKKRLRETRLYVYPDLDDEVLHHLIIGDKETQADDIQFCKEFVAGLPARKKKENERKADQEGEPKGKERPCQRGPSAGNVGSGEPGNPE